MRLFRILFAVTCLPVLFLIGCGGGTSGTGLGQDDSAQTLGQSFAGTISGYVFSSTHEPIGWVDVSVEGTGYASKTNADGFFSVDSTSNGEETSLVFTHGVTAGRVVLPLHTLEKGPIELEVTFSLEDSSIEVVVLQNGAQQIVIEEMLCSDVSCTKEK